MKARFISFDCYGTLFDWIHGVGGVLEYLFKSDVGLLLSKFFELERTLISSSEFKKYSTILREVLAKLMEEEELEYREVYGDALVLGFAKSPPFPDTIIGLRLLKEKGYRIVLLSNTERELIKTTISGLEDLVDTIITAEDLGVYKPSIEAFTRALGILGASASEVVHVSAYPYYDLEPASRLGIKTVLLDRGYGYGWEPRVRGLEELVRVIDEI